MRYFFSILAVYLFSVGQILAQGQTIRTNVNINGVTRTYFVYLPARYTGSEELPLVINMHGFGSDATEQAVYSRFNNLADLNKFIVAYPEGLEATVNSLGTGQHWNSYFETGIDDISFLDRMIDLIWNEYSIDLSRVYATGMSNGGFMAYTLACELNDRIAAVGSVTGSMVVTAFSQCDTDRPVPVIHFHGTEDQVVPIDGNELLEAVDSVIEFWRANNNCAGEGVLTEIEDSDTDDNSTVVRIAYEDCDESSIVYYRIDGGGHTWPGALIDQPLLGATNKDINAGSLTWEFFSQYSHPNPRAPEIITSLEETAMDMISVYPTLVSDHVNILTPYPARLRIYSADGRIIAETDLSGGKNRISASFWQEGMYILSVLPESAPPQQFRVVK